MDIRKLEIFIAAAKAQSISGAAKDLPMAQPAVSIAIRKLEEELACSLFERKQRGVSLTKEGQRLLLQAQGILRQVEGLKDTARDLQGLITGELSISSPYMVATYLLPDMLTEFLADYDGLTASVDVQGTNTIQELLLRDEIEIGVININEGHEKLSALEFKPLVEEKLVVCVGRQHKWAGNSELSIADLDQEPLVVYEKGYYIREQLDHLCEQQGVQADYRLQTNFLPMILQMIRRGGCAGIGLAMIAQQEPNIICVPLKPDLGLSLALAKRKRRKISRANQVFWDWV